MTTVNHTRGGHLKTKCSSSISFRSTQVKPSKFIALLTDFGLQDAYVGVMKGVIACINPEAVVIDLCHHVAPQNVRQGAFLLASSFQHFPPGTIHVAVVDPTVGSNRRAVCVAAGDFFFVGAITVARWSLAIFNVTLPMYETWLPLGN